MKAAIFERYGGLDVLQIKNIPEPVPDKNELLIKIHSASLNPVDWKLRHGDLKLVVRGGFPRVVGADFSGKIVKTGASVSGFKVGDLVFGGVSQTNSREGACAEFLKIPADRVTLKPHGVTHQEAAALPIAGRTALQALRDLGNIKPGQTVLINGATGGVGSFAIQLAKSYKARVVAFCSAKNAEMAKSLGADVVFDYTKQSVEKLDYKFHIIFDVTPTTSFFKIKHELFKGGTYISTLPSGPNLGAYLVAPLLGKRSKIIILKSKTEDLDYLSKSIEDKKLKVVIDRVFDLDHTREAYELSETGHVTGKIIVNVC